MARSSNGRNAGAKSATARNDRPDDYEDGTARAPKADGESGNQTGGGFGVREWLRWFWRQLTSMRVALILLLMLAIATIPGSLLPQRSADPNGVVQYEQDHPELFTVLDAFPITAFDVYSSVWFSSIYLLLFVSLIGCVLPRIAQHWRALRSEPPRTPARLQRMAGFAEQRVANPDSTAEQRAEFADRAIAEAETLLRTQRYRTAVQRVERRRDGVTEVSVSAERGYMRETGNLLFHISLVGVLIAVALGGLYSFNGQKVIVEGETMLNQLIDYDSANSGQWFQTSRLEPFSMRMDSLEIDYINPDDENQNAVGQVLEYRANVTLIETDGSESESVIRVNHPLRVHGSPIYLIANGYAPTITVRDPEGTVVFSESVPFIPQDTAMTSLGVVKVPYGIDAEGEETQLALHGFFYPSAYQLSTGAFTSGFPDLLAPLLSLDVYIGDLGINEGVPQSVYTLDTDSMQKIAGRETDLEALRLTVGETVELPNGMGTVSLEAVPRFASFDVMRNPAQVAVLVSALLAIGGLLLSLFVPRRRVWVKAVPSDSGVVLQYAALARGDDPALERAVEELRESHRERL